jgi:Invasion associated locus B (IalB) protein
MIDKEPAISSAFFTCFANGCMADYEATPELVGKLKTGQMLTIVAINFAGKAVSFSVPLADSGGTASLEPMRGHRPIQTFSRRNKNGIGLDAPSLLLISDCARMIANAKWRTRCAAALGMICPGGSSNIAGLPNSVDDFRNGPCVTSNAGHTAVA